MALHHTASALGWLNHVTLPLRCSVQAAKAGCDWNVMCQLLPNKAWCSVGASTRVKCLNCVYSMALQGSVEFPPTPTTYRHVHSWAQKGLATRTRVLLVFTRQLSLLLLKRIVDECCFENVVFACLVTQCPAIDQGDYVCTARPAS